MDIISILVAYWPGLVSGLATTAALVLLSVVLALAEGVPIGIYLHRSRIGYGIIRIAYFLASGLPLIIAFYWANYPLQELLNVVWSPFWVSVAVLGQFGAILLAHSIGHALRSMPVEPIELAKSLSLSSVATSRHIVFPIILERVLPEFFVVVLWIMQGTLFASLISVQELFRVTQQINAVVHAPVLSYSALAVVFVFACTPVFALSEFYLRRLRRRGMLY